MEKLKLETVGTFVAVWCQIPMMLEAKRSPLHHDPIRTPWTLAHGSCLSSRFISNKKRGDKGTLRVEARARFCEDAVSQGGER